MDVNRQVRQRIRSHYIGNIVTDKSKTQGAFPVELELSDQWYIFNKGSIKTDKIQTEYLPSKQ